MVSWDVIYFHYTVSIQGDKHKSHGKIPMLCSYSLILDALSLHRDFSASSGPNWKIPKVSIRQEPCATSSLLVGQISTSKASRPSLEKVGRWPKKDGEKTKTLPHTQLFGVRLRERPNLWTLRFIWFKLNPKKGNGTKKEGRRKIHGFRALVTAFSSSGLM